MSNSINITICRFDNSVKSILVISTTLVRAYPEKTCTKIKKTYWWMSTLMKHVYICTYTDMYIYTASIYKLKCFWLSKIWISVSIGKGEGSRYIFSRIIKYRRGCKPQQ